ncbi:hypothetical protein D3C73_1420510 [compost metagenome]
MLMWYRSDPEADNQVDELDADERHDDSSETVDKDIAAQQLRRAHRFIRYTLHRQRNQQRDNNRIKDQCGENG